MPSSLFEQIIRCGNVSITNSWFVLFSQACIGTPLDFKYQLEVIFTVFALCVGYFWRFSGHDCDTNGEKVSFWLVWSDTVSMFVSGNPTRWCREGRVCLRKCTFWKVETKYTYSWSSNLFGIICYTKDIAGLTQFILTMHKLWRTDTYWDGQSLPGSLRSGARPT